MKRRVKRFDNGGSVMDRVSPDMSNPAYRKQLEQEQALETSSPESVFLGGAPRALKGAGALIKSGGVKGSSKSLTDNLVIGSGARQKDRINKAIEEHVLSKLPEHQREHAIKRMQNSVLDARKEANKQAAKGQFLDKVLDAEVRTMRTFTAENAPKIASRVNDVLEDRELRRQERESRGGMKKGGTVKVKSASARADGCCIRGKTRA